jgi:hypothetical protein
MSSGLTPTQEAWLRAQRMRETFSGFTAHEIETMPMDEFARMTGREFGSIEPVEPPGGPVPAAVHPGREQPEAVTAAQHQGTDFHVMSMAEYGRARDQLGIGRSPSARGLFD